MTATVEIVATAVVAAATAVAVVAVTGIVEEEAAAEASVETVADVVATEVVEATGIVAAAEAVEADAATAATETATPCLAAILTTATEAAGGRPAEVGDVLRPAAGTLRTADSSVVVGEDPAASRTAERAARMDCPF